MGRSSRPRSTAAAAAALATGLLAALAAAQDPVPRPDPRFLEIRIAPRASSLGRPPIPPLPATQQQRLHRARALREAGRLEEARDTLAILLTELPHHPLALVELARVHQSRQAWRSIELIARAGRAARRDSLLLAHELTDALERQNRPREAAQVVFEAWVAGPLEADWARPSLERLAAADPRGVRDVARRVALAVPARAELVAAAARLEWRHGDAESALRMLGSADDPSRPTPLRWAFAEEMLVSATGRDSAGAVEVFLDLAADRRRDHAYRLAAARRAWEIHERRGEAIEGAPRLARALQGVPGDLWGPSLTVAVTRALREGGLTHDARGLLRGLGESARAIPEIALERALNDLRDGPPEKALDALAALAPGSREASFRLAEALFFAGAVDSAHAWYERVARDPADPFAGAALERLFLIEDADPRSSLALFGRIAYERWRGEPRRALGLADSLFRSLPRGPLWAHAALVLATLREAAGDGKAALDPLLAVADNLPDDRLAPVARQRAGDVLRLWHKDDARALQQYEECLARYPKAWNAPEVRRTVETLRRERRF